MSERKINLEKILNNEAVKAGYLNFTQCFVEQDYTEEVVKQAMIVACRQILELAAENAKIQKDLSALSRTQGAIWIDKQSILNTINQIEI